MRARAVVVVAAALTALAGCERRADVTHPRRFDAGGLSFSYPGNWKVTAATHPEGLATVRSITVESPGDGLVMIEEFKPAITIELDEFLGRLVATMRAVAARKTRSLVALRERGAAPVARRLLGDARTGRRRRFEITALGERVPHTIEGYSVGLPDRALVILAQAPDEDLALVTPGFTQIFDSVAVK